MKEVVRSVYANRLADLFEGEPTVTVQCPRCGHQWELSEEDLGG